ncbi:MAG: hypothetical protein ABSG95_01655 [Solirubrobacteraceae bacterium]
MLWLVIGAALIALAASLAGVVMALVSALVLLNVSVVIIGAMFQRRRPKPAAFTREIPPSPADTARERIAKDEEPIRVTKIPH